MLSCTALNDDFTDVLHRTMDVKGTPMKNEQSYEGTELELFKKAENWKGYLAHAMRPYLKGKVLEVGAGIGATTKAICSDLRLNQVLSWLCLDLDPKQMATIQQDIDQGKLPPYCTAQAGTLDGLVDDPMFDAILYIDVLEHIQDDRAQLVSAAAHLSRGGKLIVLAPAHGWLFTEFDRVVGHFRRYTSGSLVSLKPPDTNLVSCRYYDSVGMTASLANRLLLRQSVPTQAQISVWDRFMVPISRRIDPLFGHRIGKSILGVWEKVA